MEYRFNTEGNTRKEEVKSSVLQRDVTYLMLPNSNKRLRNAGTTWEKFDKCGSKLKVIIDFK